MSFSTFSLPYPLLSHRLNVANSFQNCVIFQLNRIGSTASEIEYRSGTDVQSVLPQQLRSGSSCGQPILIFQQCRLSNRVVTEYTFFWTTRIGCNDFFLAAWAGVMCNFVTQASTTKSLFGDANRLWFRNLLDNPRFHAEWVTKLSSAIRTSIFRDLHVPIRLCRRSRYPFIPFLLPRLLSTAFILILFTACSHV